MKLSDAMRLGAMLRPQSFTSYFSYGKSCAMGAACEAVGINPLTIEGVEAMNTRWAPIILAERFFFPPCGCNVIVSAFGAITHLNDEHKWTRERIADWVATVEPPDAVEQPALMEQLVLVAVEARCGE